MKLEERISGSLFAHGWQFGHLHSAKHWEQNSVCSFLLARGRSWLSPRHSSSAPHIPRRDYAPASHRSPSMARPPERSAHTEHRIQLPKSIENLSSCDSPCLVLNVLQGIADGTTTGSGQKKTRSWSPGLFFLSDSLKQRSIGRRPDRGLRQAHRDGGGDGGICC